MELRESHLRYLLAIYALGKEKPDVGTGDIANILHYSKASVTTMVANLMGMGLLVRERYGKIYLTDKGFLLAKDLQQCISKLCERLPVMELGLTGEETEAMARLLAMNLPDRCRKLLTGRKG